MEIENQYSIYLELVAIGAGSLSGVLHSVQKKYDVVGIVMIGIATGVGGGLLRDSLLSSGPALALRHPAYFLTGLTASFVGMFWASLIRRIRPALWVVDSISLGLFAVVGSQRALEVGLRPGPAVFLGVITSVGGGVIRDVLCQETPAVLAPGQPYAVAAILAGATYTACVMGFDMRADFAQLIAIGTAFIVRALSAWKAWETPLPPDLSRPLFRNGERKNGKDKHPRS